MGGPSSPGSNMPAPVRCQFGPFMLDFASFRLWRGALEVPLTPKAFEIPALLVRERHRALTKQELFDAVWPDTAVTENTLTQRIKRSAGRQGARTDLYPDGPAGGLPVRRRRPRGGHRQPG